MKNGSTSVISFFSLSFLNHVLMHYDHMVVVLYNDMWYWLSNHIGFEILATFVFVSSEFPWQKLK